MNSFPSRRIEAGFTLLEIITAITVMGILLGLAVPAFTEMMRNNRTAAQTNEFTTALALARSEAGKRGSPVVVCAAGDANQTTCAGAAEANWANGWIVFSDTGATVGQLDAAESVIAKRPALTDGMSLTSNNTGFLRFTSSGAPTINNASFAIRHANCKGNNVRSLTMNATGRVSIQKGAC